MDTEVFVVPCYYTGPPGLEIIPPTADEYSACGSAIALDPMFTHNGASAATHQLLDVQRGEKIKKSQLISQLHLDQKNCFTENCFGS